MRWQHIVTRILLIISAIAFALAAPVSVEENNIQTRVDVPNISQSVATVLEKRLAEELEKLGEDYLETSGKSIDSPGTHPPSSTAPSGPDHGSTNVQPPAPNLESSAANPDPSTESSCSPSCSSPTSSMRGLWARGQCFLRCHRLLEWYSELIDPPRPPRRRPQPVAPATLSDPGSELDRPVINPSAGPDLDRGPWKNAEDPPPSSAPPRSRPKKMDVGQTSGYGPGPPPKDSEIEYTGPPGSTFYSTTVVEVPPPPSPDTGRPTEPPRRRF